MMWALASQHGVFVPADCPAANGLGVDNCRHHLEIICTQFCIAAPVKIQNNMILRKICYHYTELI